MELLIGQDIESMASLAADVVCEVLAHRPAARLCLAAGGTPRPLYAELCRRARAGRETLSEARLVTFDEMRVVKLDEWHGMPLDDPATCETDLRQHLLEPLGIADDRYLGFDSFASDPDAECRRVADIVQGSGPLDLCVLGLGLNGHIGMNEPAEELPSRAHVAQLAEQSRHHAMLRHLADPPTKGMTLGMEELMQADQVLLVVTGEGKREALRRLVEGPVTTQFPASLLKLHPRCTCVADAAAAGTDRGA